VTQTVLRGTPQLLGIEVKGAEQPLPSSTDLKNARSYASAVSYTFTELIMHKNKFTSTSTEMS
jgi:hypothetical protein